MPRALPPLTLSLQFARFEGVELEAAGAAAKSGAASSARRPSVIGVSSSVVATTLGRDAAARNPWASPAPRPR